MNAPRVLLIVLGLLGSVGVAQGCTFGGLGDYDVESCSVAGVDPCKRLSGGDACHSYQCNPDTDACELQVRDDDGDGDPSVACGGTDCDDADSSRNGNRAEICDGKDNTCEGLVDEGVLEVGETDVYETPTLGSDADLQFTTGPAGDVATFVGAAPGGGRCIQALRIGRQSADFLGTGCSFLGGEVNLSPRQAQTRLIGSGGATAFIATSGCAHGTLGYRYAANLTSGDTLACDAVTKGASLPSVGLSPSGAEGVLLYYDVALSERDSLEDCQSLFSAPLRLVPIRQANGQSPVLDVGAQITLAGETASLRPAAIQILNADLWVASPSGSSVGLWNIATGNIDAEPVAYTLPGLSGARGVALTIRPDGEFAVTAEVGCPGAQTLKVNFGSVAGGFEDRGAVEVTGAPGLATQSSVTWNAGRSEWLVTWISTGPELRVRRFSKEGEAIGEGMLALAGASAGLATDPLLGRVDSGVTTYFRGVNLGCQ